MWFRRRGTGGNAGGIRSIRIRRIDDVVASAQDVAIKPLCTQREVATVHEPARRGSIPNEIIQADIVESIKRLRNRRPGGDLRKIKEQIQCSITKGIRNQIGSDQPVSTTLIRDGVAPPYRLSRITIHIAIRRKQIERKKLVCN